MFISNEFEKQLELLRSALDNELWDDAAQIGKEMTSIYYQARSDDYPFKLPPIRREKVLDRGSAFGAMSQSIGYHISNHNIPEVWTKTKGEGVVVAVLDTGAQISHEDMSGRFALSQPEANDGNGHGTHCCGIVGANNNSLGIVGVAPEAKLLAIKVLGDDGYGTAGGVAEGIDRAVDLGADVISLSLGADIDLPYVQAAVRRAYEKNIPCICASGNNGDTGMVGYPANYPETIAIGALDKSNLRAGFSQTGDNLDFMAPGVSILSTIPNNQYQYMSGTSMAAPWAAGVVALMISKHRKFGGSTPVDTVEQIREHLQKTAVDLGSVGKDANTGFGLIDVRKAIESEMDVSEIPDIIVSNMMANPPGNDHKNLTEEYVEFMNISGFDTDMSGWTMNDKAGWNYNFPRDFVLKAGEKVRVITGLGDDSSSELYWGYRRAIWNNGGDTVYLNDDQSRIVIEYTYGK